MLLLGTVFSLSPQHKEREDMPAAGLEIGSESSDKAPSCRGTSVPTSHFPTCEFTSLSSPVFLKLFQTKDHLANKKKLADHLTK